MSKKQKKKNRTPPKGEKRQETVDSTALYGDGADQLMNWLGIGSAKEALSEVTYFISTKVPRLS